MRKVNIAFWSFLHLLARFYKPLRPWLRLQSGEVWCRVKRRRSKLSNRSSRRCLWIPETQLLRDDEVMYDSTEDHRSDARKIHDERIAAENAESRALETAERMARLTGQAKAR